MYKIYKSRILWHSCCTALHNVAQVYQIIWLIAIVMFSMIPSIILQGNTHLVWFIMPEPPCYVFSLRLGLQHHWHSTTQCSYCRFLNIPKKISPVRDICLVWLLENIGFIMCFQSHHCLLSTPACNMQRKLWSGITASWPHSTKCR